MGPSASSLRLTNDPLMRPLFDPFTKLSEQTGDEYVGFEGYGIKSRKRGAVIRIHPVVQ